MLLFFYLLLFLSLPVLQVASGIERNHKLGNLVLDQRRCKMLDMNSQRQVFITHNHSQLERKMALNNESKFELYLKESKTDHNSTDAPVEVVEDNTEKDDMSLDEVVASLDAAIYEYSASCYHNNGNNHQYHFP